MSAAQLDPSLRPILRSVGGFPAVGETFAARLALSGVENLDGYGVRIHYDAEYLDLLRIERNEGTLSRALMSTPGEAVILNYGKGAVSPPTFQASAKEVATPDTPLMTLWFRVKAPSPTPPVWLGDMVVLDADGNRRIPEDLASVRLSLVPNQVVLLPNYPNPFNPTTTIRYGIPEPSRVSIVVYNILGQRLATLVNREQPAGYYTITWDGRDAEGRRAASGVYLYRMEAGKTAHVQKMLLLR